ncbi:MAG: DUF11 domain-containing protein [Anaerolineae bacterium]|nr:DUF11 domain-containing protein [Anaerolineae bacterium]
MHSEQRTRRTKRWVLLAIPLAALLLFLPRLAVQAEPPSVPALGVTPTPTFTPTPTPTPPSDVEVDPEIVKRADKEVADIGEEVVFTLEVRNKGKDAAVDVIVTDDIAPELEILEVTSTQTDASLLDPPIQVQGQLVTVAVGTVGQYDQNGDPFVVEITIRTRVLAAPPDCAIENVAFLTSTNGGDRQSNWVVVLLPSTLPICGIETRPSPWWAAALLAATVLVAVGVWRLHLARSGVQS